MRPWACFRAFVTGYFWLPCPICGRMFGGYEKGGGYLRINDSTSRMTCPRCPGYHERRPGAALGGGE